MAGQGFVGLGGAAGAADGFETLMTRRLLEQKQAQEAAQQDKENQYRQATLDETRRSREAQEAELVRNHDELAKDRELGRQQQRRVLALSMPAGSVIDAGAVQDLEKDEPLMQGLFDPVANTTETQSAPQMTDDAGKPVSISLNDIVRPPTQYRFRGKEADQLRQQGLDDANTRADNDRLMKITLAQLAATAKANDPGQTKVMAVKDPDGTYRNVLVNNRGEELYSGAQPEPGGVRAKLGDMAALDQQIGSLIKMGEGTNWAGTGPVTATVGSLRKQVTGGGSDTQDALRVMLDSVRADIAHEKYGSAFTSTERGMLNSFAPSSTMKGPAIGNRLRIMQAIIQTRQRELSNGGVLGQTTTPVNDLLQQYSQQLPMSASTPGGAAGTGRASGAGPATGSSQPYGGGIQSITRVR